MIPAYSPLLPPSDLHMQLLKLKGLMRTAAGREVAEGRHAYMEQFLQRFHEEWQGKA